MNTTDKTEEYKQRAISALKTLRQKFEKVSKIAPNWQSISNLSDLPEDKAEDAEKQLWDIFAYGEYYVEKVLSDLKSYPVLSSGDLQRLQQFHKEEYKSLVEKIRELVPDLAQHAPTREDVEKDVVEFEEMEKDEETGKWMYTNPSTASEVDDYMDEYEGGVLRAVKSQVSWSKSLAKLFAELAGENHAKNAESRADDAEQSPAKKKIADKKQDIKTVFDAVGEAASEHVYQNFADDYEMREYWVNKGVDLALYNKIISKLYFNPGDWVANENEWSPIIVAWDLKKFPRPILLRVNEIYLSFIYGNWMAVIALSRCLLEYVIDNQKSLFQIENAHDQSLKDLISAVEKTHPALAARMTCIRKEGNKVMHIPYNYPKNPFGKMKVLEFPQKKPAAKKCVENILEIIGALYSK